MTIKQILSSLSGLKLIKTGLSSAREIANDKTAGAGLGLIREAAGQLKHKPSGTAETFAGACRRQDIDAADLARISTSLAASAKFFRVTAWLCVACAALSFLTTDSLYWYTLYLINGAALGAMCAAFAVRDTFRCWQVEIRELASFADFRNDGGIMRALVN